MTGSADEIAADARAKCLYWARCGKRETKRHELRAAYVQRAANYGIVALALSAQAIEARRAETRSGSVHESAVPEGNAP